MFAPHTLRAFIMFKEMCADWYIMFSAIWVVGGSKEQNGNIMWYTNCTSPTTWWYSWYVPNNGALYLHLVDGFLTFSHLFGESLTSAFGIGFATVSVIASPHLLGLPGSTVLGEGNQNKKVTYGHLQQSHMADLKEISSLLLEFIPVGGATASASARFLAASPIFEGLAPSAASWSVSADTAVFSSSMWSEQPAEWAAKWASFAMRSGELCWSTFRRTRAYESACVKELKDWFMVFKRYARHLLCTHEEKNNRLETCLLGIGGLEKLVIRDHHVRQDGKNDAKPRNLQK